MNAKKVAVFATSFLNNPIDGVSGGGEGAAVLRGLTEKLNEISIDYRCDRDPSARPVPEEFEGVVAVIADLEPYSEDLLERIGIGNGGSLELIVRYGVGYESVDVAAATRAGILVANTPGANSRPTAEWAVATLLDIAGRRMPNHHLSSAGKGKGKLPRLDVSGKILGVVGTGGIGKTVVELLEGFRMNVIAFDPFPDEKWAGEVGVEYTGFDDLLGKSDFITLHAATGRRIIGTEELGRMKETAALVNCARGVLVDNRAAYAAVADGRLWGYGLDEVWTETDLPLDGLNIAVSPHVGSDTGAGMVGMQILSARHVADYFLGTPRISPINPKAFDYRR